MSAETNTNIETIDNRFNNNNNNNNQVQQPQSPRQLNMTADGGTVVGLGAGKLTCNLHGFETFDTAEMTQHCIDNPDGHAVVGQQKCVICDNIIELPAEEGGIPVADCKDLQCPDCFNRQQNLHQNFQQGNRIRIRRAEQQQQQSGQNNNSQAQNGGQ